MRKLLLITLLLVTAFGVNAQENKSIFATIKRGLASFYHDKFEGRRTANGEVFDNDKFTCASNSLKMGSYIKVTNVSNGEVVYVKVNDRMSNNGRLVDLASVAAKRLGFDKKGVTKVKVEVVPKEVGQRGVLAQTLAQNNYRLGL